MRLRDAAKWIKEKITGKKTEETPVLTPMIATEEDIEKAKEMDREIEEMEKKSALMARSSPHRQKWSVCKDSRQIQSRSQRWQGSHMKK